MYKPVDCNHFVTSCGGGNKITEDSKKYKSKELYENVRYVSNQNLEDLYDKEGYRDGEFKKVTKGCGRYTQISLKVINRVN